tara:strand:+ start:3334 stop:4707 length:1374 start_codon:yes stop_codon:yes gene_type:complete
MRPFNFATPSFSGTKFKPYGKAPFNKMKMSFASPVILKRLGVVFSNVSGALRSSNDSAQNLNSKETAFKAIFGTEKVPVPNFNEIPAKFVADSEFIKNIEFGTGDGKTINKEDSWQPKKVTKVNIAGIEYTPHPVKVRIRGKKQNATIYKPKMLESEMNSKHTSRINRIKAYLGLGAGSSKFAQKVILEYVDENGKKSYKALAMSTIELSSERYRKKVGALLKDLGRINQLENVLPFKMMQVTGKSHPDGTKGEKNDTLVDKAIILSTLVEGDALQVPIIYHRELETFTINSLTCVARAHQQDVAVMDLKPENFAVSGHVLDGEFAGPNNYSKVEGLSDEDNLERLNQAPIDRGFKWTRGYVPVKMMPKIKTMGYVKQQDAFSLAASIFEVAEGEDFVSSRMKKRQNFDFSINDQSSLSIMKISILSKVLASENLSSEQTSQKTILNLFFNVLSTTI